MALDSFKSSSMDMKHPEGLFYEDSINTNNTNFESAPEDIIDTYNNLILQGKFLEAKELLIGNKEEFERAHELRNQRKAALEEDIKAVDAETQNLNNLIGDIKDVFER